jgi:hypothetical protein
VTIAWRSGKLHLMAEADTQGRILTDASRHSRRLLEELSKDQANLAGDHSLSPADLAAGQKALQEVIDAARCVREVVDRG